LTICSALERWQLSASVVTIVPLMDSITSIFGTAVILRDFASVATCTSTKSVVRSPTR
jgi:hypothetical protein